MQPHGRLAIAPHLWTISPLKSTYSGFPDTQTNGRKRRSTDELIADYEKKIREVKARAKEKELKSSPAMKRAVSLVKAMDRCLSEAAEEGNNHLRHAVADGRKALSKYLQTQGVTLPKANLPRGRKPS